MSNTPITIVDYTLGNLHNLQQAFESLGCTVNVTGKKSEIEKAEKLVLPGVGNFGAGMTSLKELGLDSAVKTYAKTGRPLLGICLGMQMLLSSSEEDSAVNGLNLIEGEVKRFQPSKETPRSFKIPHYGWSEVSKKETTPRLLKDIPDNAFYYFVHSYYVDPKDSKHSIGITSYGYNTYTSIINKDNIFGCQFHPEISGPIGLKLLQNFVTSI